MWWQGLLLLLSYISASVTQEQESFSLNSTFNLVKHLEAISASNTCGEDGPELYCLLTGTPLAPGLDYTYSRYPGEYIDGQYCNTCQTGQHRIENTIDEDEDNWWQSSSLATIPDYNQKMNIELFLGQEYQVVYFVLKAANSPRPARWVLEKSTDYGQTYEPWQIYVPTDSDCELYYNITASQFPVDFYADDQIICTSYYSKLNPLENGQIYTTLVVGRPGAELFYLNESPRLQQWMKATNVRLRLEQMQILHNLVNEEDDTANRRFFYSIREIIVAGRCSCNGHAEFCTKMSDKSVTCECGGNTCGANCQQCCPGYNVFPWQPSSSGQFFECEKCQCYGHSEECEYDAAAEGRSVDTEGNIRGGAVCTDCQDNTEGLNCERCKEGYFRGERESLYDKTCRLCDCNTANIELVEGMEFGSCNQDEYGQCYCKEPYGGRQCNECRADHFNTVSNGLSCDSCDCEIKGTVSQLQNCADLSGVCFCKDNVIGDKCNACRDQTFNITIDNDYGCSECACNPGGSQNNNCDKVTGQCDCKPGLDGRQCDEVAHKHYIPGPDHLSMEAEDGMMRGRQALYDFNEEVFKDGFSGKGYATLNRNVPQVDMEITIPDYTRYKVKIAYQLEDSFQEYTGTIIATNKETGDQQQYEATLDTCVDGCDVTLQRCFQEVCEDVSLTLTPGDWIISFSYNAPAFNLDRVVLTPRNFEEPYIAHTDLTSCARDNQALCNQFHLPNLEPYIHKTEGSNPVDLTGQETNFTVEDEGAHSIILDFLYNSSTIDEMTVTITDGDVEKTGYVTLHDCNELQMCRAIIRDEHGQPLIYDSVPGELSVKFNENIPNPIEGKMYLVVNTDDLIYALKPQYICMTGLDGVCTVNSFPVAYPRNIRPATKGYIVDDDGNKISSITEDFIEPRTNYDNLVQIMGSADVKYEVRVPLLNNPNTYRMVLEYFYTGLEDLSVTVTFTDDSGQIGEEERCGYIKHSRGNCIHVEVEPLPGAELTLDEGCREEDKYYCFTPEGEIRHQESGLCVQPHSGGSDPRNSERLVLNECGAADDASKFDLTEDGSIQHRPSGKCWHSSDSSPSPRDGSTVVLHDGCDEERLEFKPNFVSKGVVTFSPCNGYSVCRTLIMNQDENSEFYGTPFLNFDPRYVYLTFEDLPVGKAILLNDILTTTAPTLTSTALVTPLPLVRTEQFINNCTVESEEEFCQEGFLTIAAEFYDGLPECQCSPEGSLSDVCDVYGGQCTCKPNVIGRNCDRCAAGYFNFPDCQPCPIARCAGIGGGFSGVCNEDTGECDCAPNVIGERCDQCDADSYDYDDVLGCRDCDCNLDGSTGGSCDEIGQCYCKNDTITGIKCDRCVEGRTNFPTCHPCGCNEAGSTGSICNHVTGQCPCKESVTGLLCDECKYGHYNLQEDREEGCQECFCFGITVNCTVASMAYYKIGREFEAEDTQGWLIIDSRADKPTKSNSFRPLIQESTTFTGLYELVALSSSVSIELRTSDFDWLAPAPYQGDLMYSYGGFFKFNFGYFPNRGGAATRPPRVEIMGYGVGIYRELELPEPDTYTPYKMVLDTGHWYSTNSPDSEATIEEIMRTLVDVKSIRLRGKLTDDLATYRLMSVSLDSAFPSNNGLARISHIEQCFCPEGYTGTSCESCTEGYYRVPTRGYPLGECVKCDCNGHSDTCNQETGVCRDCRDNTEGDHCEVCRDGYYGDPSDGQSCQICPCPLPVAGNSFGTCDYDPLTGGSLTCECQAGYEGDNCGQCSQGYYGTPTVVGGSCQQCSTCNNNTDVTGDYCDTTTGDCTLCLFDTAGDQCEHCADGFYGDAIQEKNCSPCDCDSWGTVEGSQCDSSTGECNCLPNVVGDQCDTCDEGHWNASFAGVFENTECESRECAVQLSDGPASSSRFLEVKFTRTAGSTQRITFFDRNGDPAEFIEIEDAALAPSYTIGLDSNCRFTKFFDPSVLAGSDTVTIEISISESDIMLFINGVPAEYDDPLPNPISVDCDGTVHVYSEFETGESYDRRTSNTVLCSNEPRNIKSMSFHSDVVLEGEVQYESTTGGIGCTSCECNENGTIGGACDTNTGQCVCHDEVEGFKCDMCKEDFYGLNTLGHCTACDCNIWGSNSTDCDKETGQCQCLEGNTGQQCDICGDWAVVTAEGCENCTGCTAILRDYIGELSDEIGETIRAKEAGGRISQDIEELIDMKNTAILLKKEALDTHEQVERYQGLWGTEFPVKSGSLKYKYNKLADKYDSNLLVQLEETEDMIRSKEESINSVVSQTGECNDTYTLIFNSAQSSKDIIDNVKITAAKPAVIQKAIKKSKNKISKMKQRRIYAVKQKLIDGLAELNSTVYADYGSLVRDDLGDIGTRISSLSGNMKAVLANAVDSVASPIDEFTSDSEIVTGDLSNLKKSFDTRKRALETRVANLTQTVEEHSIFELHNDVVAAETTLEEHFNPSDRDLTQELREDVTERADFLKQSGQLDMSSNKDNIHRLCRPIRLFMEAPENTKVQMITDLQSFNNDTTVLSDTINRLTTTANQATRKVNNWSGTNLNLKQDELNAITQMSMNLETSLPTLEARVQTDDLDSVIAGSQAKNQELRGRLDDVLEQTEHQPRAKRYVSVHSAEGFTTVSKEMSKELKKQDKSNKKLEKVRDFISEAERKVSEVAESAQQNTQNVQSIMRLVDSEGEESFDYKIEQLKNKPSLSLAEKMRELEAKMEKIKEKMAATRELTSTVQVGVKMTDYSYLKLPMPLVAEQSSRYTGLSMMIKTEESSGTLLYLGARGSTDMIHLRLVGGTVQLKFDIGEGSTTVNTDVQVDDNNWHTVRVSRNGKFGYISIDSGNNMIKSFSGANGGSLDLLELDTDGYFFIGCSRDTANSTIKSDMFKGSITQLYISNKPIGLWGYTESGGSLSPTQALVELSQFTEAPRNGLCMKGWGYAMYPCNGVTVSQDSALRIDVRVQTYDRDGLLFRLHNVNTTESLDLSLVDGIPKLTGPQASYEPAGLDSENTGYISTFTNSKVTVELSGTSATLSVNDVPTTQYTLSSALNWEEEDCKEIYVGGDNSTSVSGVVRSVSVDNILFSLSQQDAEVFQGMAPTCLSSKTLDGLTAFGSGYARYTGVDFEDGFRVDIRIRTTQPYGVVFFASDALGFNTISLSVDDGQVEFTAMRNYAKTAVRTGQDASDGNFHEVSIVREGKKITLNMDGFTSSTMLRENVIYPTSHGFWLAGIPHDVPLLLDVVPQLLPFEGAIRALAINGETVDLQEFTEATQVTLSGTSIRPSTKTYRTVE